MSILNLIFVFILIDRTCPKTCFPHYFFTYNILRNFQLISLPDPNFKDVYFSFHNTFLSLKSTSTDVKKSAYMFIIEFLHLMGGTDKRKQVNSNILWNDRGNKHIGNCGKFCPKRANIIIIINK
jgi:hypothetical protein